MEESLADLPLSALPRVTIMEGRACNKSRQAEHPQKSASSHSHHRRRNVQFRHTDATGIGVATPSPSPGIAFSCGIPPISPLILEGRACNRRPAVPSHCHTCDNCRFGRRSVQITGGGTCRPWKVERADRFRAPSALMVSTQIMGGGYAMALIRMEFMEGGRCNDFGSAPQASPTRKAESARPAQ